MNKITLQFTVAIKGPEATLQHLHQQLNPAHAHHSVLCEALPVMIREALIAAGTCPEVEVELHPCQLMNHYEGTGGLEGELWVQAYGLDYTPDNESMLIKIQSEAEILCSDQGSSDYPEDNPKINFLKFPRVPINSRELKEVVGTENEKLFWDDF